MLPQPILKSKKVNLRRYPPSDIQEPGTTLTVGDMHGNTMKLLWILIREGAISMEEKDFDEMWKIYDGMDIPTDDALKKFDRILNNIVIKNPKFSLRLIGDVFADRGKNDYLTLRILEKLHIGGIKPEILFSNHDAFLLRSYNLLSKKFNIREPDQRKSFEGLSKLNEKHKAEIEGLVQKYVVPNIKLISYFLSSDKQQIDLFMHAPNDFKEIAGLITKFNEKFATTKKFATTIETPAHKGSPESFAKIIDNLNRVFALYMSEPKDGTTELDQLLHDFIWSRLPKSDGNISFELYPPCVRQIIHGHTPTPYCNRAKQINIDTPLGKEIPRKSANDHDPNKGDYRAFSTFSAVVLSAKDQYHQSWMTNIDAKRRTNIANARKWIEEIKEMVQPEKPESDNKKLLKIVETANALLDGYIWRKSKENPEELLKNFTNAVKEAGLPSSVLEKIYKSFLIYISDFTKLETKKTAPSPH